MRIAAILIFISLHLGVQAQAATPDLPTQTNRFICCRFPIRVFTNATVNLNPLFIWWKLYGTNTPANDHPRPLVAWHRITGSSITETDGYWLVNATIYTNAKSAFKKRIYINHPPVIEAETFVKLKAEINIDNKQKSLDERDLQSAQKVQPQRSGKNHPISNGRQAEQNRQLAISMVADEKLVDQDLALTEKKLSAIPSSNGKYSIDLFALETGEEMKGVPIYDFGTLPANPQ